MKYDKKTETKQSKNGHTKDKKLAQKNYYKHESYEFRFLTVIS